MWETGLPVLSEVTELNFLYGSAVDEEQDHPHSFLLSPVHQSFAAGQRGRDELAGFIAAILPWDSYFSNLLLDGVEGIVVVLHDTCGQDFTYRVDGPKAVFLGPGDLHDSMYDHLEIRTEFAPFLKHNFSDVQDHCEYDLKLYPSVEFEAPYRTSKPATYTSIVVVVFLFTASVFVFYDYLVQYRQDKVMATAKRTNAIVTSIFPKNVRDRVMNEAKEQIEEELNDKRKKGVPSLFGGGAKSRIKDFLDEGTAADSAMEPKRGKPIADLFPEVTILFADIAGFTAWSSVREPCQVFQLLETLFEAFDEIALRRRVYKVETVGGKRQISSCYTLSFLIMTFDPQRSGIFSPSAFTSHYAFFFNVLVPPQIA